jgi:hypothetical protein
MQPTIVLVHGAVAESSSWDGVIDPLARGMGELSGASRASARSRTSTPPRQ